MSVVDNRVVQLLFDNKQFESGVQESTKSLNNLNNNLNKFGASSTAGNAVQELAEKFNRLGIVGITAIQNITNKITNDLVRAVKSVSVDQITAGFSKYEDKITSVQTIMSATTQTWEDDANGIIRSNELIAAGFDEKIVPSLQNLYSKLESGEIKTKGLSKELKKLGISTDDWNNALKVINGSTKYTGSQMDYVSEQLQRLNWFTDETSYSFTDMTSNIGKFTSQGQSLSSSVVAMEGIAVWAAKSGQNAQAASRAMYNMSQALGVGAVKLMDWKSIENANMATAEFKEQAIKAAVACGTLTEKAGKYYVTGKNIEVTTQNFSQTLSEGWFSSKALMSVLEKYGGFADEIGKVTEKFQEQGLSTTDLLEGIESIYVTAENGEKKIDPSNSAFQKWCETNEVSVKEITPYIEKLAGDEYELGRASFKAAQEAKTFHDAMGALKDGVSTAWMNLFETIFGNYEEAKKLWTDFANSGYSLFAEPINLLTEFLDRIDAHKGFENLIKGFNDLGNSVDKFFDKHGEEILTTAENIFNNITWVLTSFKNTVKAIIDPIKAAFKEIFPAKTGEEIADVVAKVSLGFQNFFQKIRPSEEAASGIQRTFQGVFAVFDIIKTVIESVIRVIGDLAPAIGDIGEGFFGVTGNIGDFIVKIRDSLKENDTFYKVLKKTADFIVPVFKVIFNAVSKVVDILSKLFNKGDSGDLDEMGNSVSNLANKLSPLATVLETIKNVASKVWGFLKGIYESVKEFISGIDFSKINFGEILKTGVGVGAGVGAISMFSSIKNFFDNGGFSKGFVKKIESIVDSLKGVFDSLKGAIKSFANEKNTAALKNLGIALLIFAAALAAFAFVSQMDGVVEGFLLMGAAIGALFGTLKLLEKVNKDVAIVAGALLLLSVALLLLAGAMAAFAAIAMMKSAWEGFALMAASLGMLIGALFALDQIGPMVFVVATALMVLSAAMLVLAVALAAFAAIAMMDSVWTGVALMAVTLGMLIGALFALDQIGPMVIVASASLMILAAAMLVLAAALAAFALVAMMDTFETGLVVMAASLLVLVAALAILGEIGPMVIVGAAALLIVSAALLVLAAALGAFAAIAMMDSFGAGLAAMAIMILVLVAALVVLGAIGAIVIVGAAALLIAAVAIGVLAAAVLVCAIALPLLAAGLEALFGAVVGLATAIVALIFEIINQTAASLVIIADSIGQAVTALFDGIGQAIAALSSGIGEGIAALGEGIAAAITAIIASIGEGIGKGLEGIGSGIEKIGDSVSTIGAGIGNVGEGVQKFSDGMKSMKGIPWGEIAVGLAQVISPLKDLSKIDLATVQTAVGELAGGFRSIITSATNMGQAGQIGVNALAAAINAGKGKVSSAASALSRAGASGANRYGDWYSAGANSVAGFIAGVNNNISAASLVGTTLANKLIEAARTTLQQNSPSKVFIDIGSGVVEGLVKGVNDNTKDAVYSVEDMALETIGTATEILAGAIENDFSDPVIRPILDLSEVTAGASALSSMFNNQRLGVEGNLTGEGLSGNSKNGTNYTYIQNNYSPKALNRMEIYRQTKNQIDLSKQNVLAKV